jgi:preprotein translocase subunit YajC
MLATLFVLFAEDAAPPAGQGPPGWYSMLPFIIMGGVLILLMTRSARRQERERQTLASTLKKNDKVLTSAGIYGTVITVSDTADEVVVKVDDNTRLKMTKASIIRNITQEEAAAAAKAGAGTPSSEAITTKPS